MFKHIIRSLIVFTSISINAQVGVNTNAPQGIFHINSNTTSDPNNNTKTDDFVVSATTGNVGIGLVNPDAKLHINTNGTSASPIPGFKLTDGNQAEGRILQTDVNGVATWKNITLFNKEPVVGTFTWAANTNLGNTNFNSISSLTLTPGTHMIYVKIHMLNTPDTGFLRTYVGTKNLGTNNGDAGGETPILGSTNFQPYMNKDFELTQSFVYTNTTSNNVTIYLNIQSDSGAVRRSRYTYNDKNNYKGVFLIENYFLSIPVN